MGELHHPPSQCLRTSCEGGIHELVPVNRRSQGSCKYLQDVKVWFARRGNGAVGKYRCEAQQARGTVGEMHGKTSTGEWVRRKGESVEGLIPANTLPKPLRFTYDTIGPNN